MVFGSNYPRIEMHKMAKAVKNVLQEEDIILNVFQNNALKLLQEPVEGVT
jgi:predicted TIM-barrel fold metal-dependent hydrolase